MNRNHVLWIGSLVTLGMVVGSANAAQYTEIQDNAFDGVNDASYVGGVFTWSADDNGDPAASQILTLIEDTGFVPGFTGNVRIEISTNFVDFNSTLQSPPRAYFQGGNLSLTFDYSPDGNIVTSHELSGTISEASIEVTSTSPNLSTLSGIIIFDSNTGVENLPSSNNWPAAGNSTAVALTFAIGGDLSAYQTAEGWQNDMPDADEVTFDTQFSLFPEERPIPEPTALTMLLAGSIAFLYRRRTA